MRVHRYWATADYTTSDNEPRSIRRGSDLSHQDALDNAKQAAQEASSKSARDLEWYEYADVGRAEAIVDEVLDGEGHRAGAVTVNRDGILVLNTASLVFVDVDIPRPLKPGGTGLIGRLFGKKKQAEQGASDPRGEALRALGDWVHEDPSRGTRVYETAGGLRYLITSPALDPTSAESDGLMDRLNADPLYRTLCRAQACYRARLTPKPWRVPGAPRVHLARPDAQGAPPSAYAAFKPSYDTACEGYATCTLVDAIGDTRAHSESDRLFIAMHDEITRAESGLELA